MPAHVPVAAATLVGFLNLPADMSSLQVFTEHQPLVLSQLQLYLTAEAYTNITSSTPSLPIAPFKAAYCFLMLSSTAEFLNLKTIGQGIVKTVGIDAASTELLTGVEIEHFKKNLEVRALKAALAYLSPDGLARLDELSPRPPKKLRIGII